MDEHVIPVLEELQRRLPPANASQRAKGNGKDGQNDVEVAEEDGMSYCFVIKL